MFRENLVNKELLVLLATADLLDLWDPLDLLDLLERLEERSELHIIYASLLMAIETGIVFTTAEITLLQYTQEITLSYMPYH